MAFPAPLVALNPLGSFAFVGSQAGTISGPNATTIHTISLDAGQTVSLVQTPALSLQASVQLRDPGGQVLATANAAAAGAPALLQATPVAIAGQYQLEVVGVAGSGDYTLELTLNGAVEEEGVLAGANNSVATAQDIAASALPLPGGGQQLTAVGRAETGTADFYQFPIAAGELATVTAAANPGSLTALELFDTAGVLIARGVAEGGSLVIRDFNAPGGQYAVRVSAAAGTAYTVSVLRGGTVEREPNDLLEMPQRLNGPTTVVGSLFPVVDFTDATGAASLEGFTATGLWHVTDKQGADLPGHSAPHIAYFGSSSTGNFNFGRVFGTLTSGPLTLRSDVSPQLTLQYRYQGEGGNPYDRAELRVSTNDGASFTTVANNNTHFAQTLTWEPVTINLASYAGQTVRLQFWFDSVDGIINGGLGWQIDDISLSGLNDSNDQYTFTANPGDQLVLTTTTPGDGSGQPPNLLDPAVDLFGPTGGALVATNDNGAADGRNAVITYTVPAGGGGLYRAVVRGAGTDGGVYTLSVAGATGALPTLTVTATTPPTGALLVGYPATYRVDFSQQLLATSVSPGDLRVNGVPASAVTAVDGDTLDFTIDGADTGDGLYAVTIAPGVLTGLSGQPVEEFVATFDTDAANPRVIASSLTPGAVVPVGGLVYQVRFSEGLAEDDLGAEDVTLTESLTGTTFAPSGFLYDDNTATVTVTYADLPEGLYALTLVTSPTGFRDRRGNLLDGDPSDTLPSGDGTPGDDFALSFSVDTDTRSFPTPLEVRPPAGGLVNDRAVTGFITPADDTDTFTLDVEDGQLVSLLVTSTGSLVPTVALLTAAGETLASASADGPGQSVAIQTVPTTGQTYRLVVGGAAGTGGYTLQAVLNANIELEDLSGGTLNDTAAQAEDLASSLLPLPAGGSRLAVTGASNGEPDFYKFVLAAGQAATLAASPLSGSVAELDLYDTAGTLLARSVRDDSGLNLIIPNFVGSGEFVARVRGGENSRYNLLVLRDAGLDVEPNDDPARPQQVEGPATLVGGLQSAASNFLIDFTDAAGAASLEGFTATGLWHVTEQGDGLPGHSAPHVAYFGSSSIGDFNFGRVFGTLTSGPLTLRSDVSPQLNLQYRYEGEGGTPYDRAEVRVSTNGGASFTTVANNSTHFGPTLTWESAAVDLSAYAGQTILLQFWFDSIDGISNTGLGWQIDDVSVTGVSDQQDHFSFPVNQGDRLVIRTLTPGDGAGQPTNVLDARLDLYNADGQLVASDDNGGPDGRNAALSYTAVSSGLYTVRVGAGSVGGVYQLQIAGSTASNHLAPIVVSVIPPNAGALAAAPPNLTVTLSESVRADTVQASDLTFSTPGVTVTGVEVVDGRTLRFGLSIPNAAGAYHYQIAAGALTDLQGLGVQPFDGSFVVDVTGPRVVATTPGTQASAPFTELTFEFDEFVLADSVSTTDVFAFTGPDGANLLNAVTGVAVVDNRVTVRFSQQLAAGPYTMTLGPDIQDLVGNQMDQNQDGAKGTAADRYTAALTLQSPDLRVEDVSTVPGAQFGQTIQVTYTVRNYGTDPAVEGWQDAIYLSTDAVLDRDDTRLLVVPTTPTRGPLDAAGGATDGYTRTETVTLPLNLASAPGTYRLIVEADVNRRQPESNENNNAAASEEVLVTLPPVPDLVVTDIRAPIEALSGQNIELTWTVRNQGTADFVGTLRDQVFLSADAVAGGDQFFNNFDFTGIIPAGGEITRVQRITLPINLEGNRFVVVRTDAANAAFEHSGEDNNMTVDDAPIAVRLAPLPNLRVASVTPPASAFSSQQTVVSWVTTNVGTGPTSAPVWYDAVYLSTDDLLDDQDVYLGRATNASYLNPGESYANSLTVTLPRGISGPYRFLVRADVGNQVYEHTAEDDNVRAGAVTAVQLTPPPDLRVTAVSAPSQAFSGQPMAVTWTVTNAGNGRTLESYWLDAVYLSADDTLDAADPLLGVFAQSGFLNAGAGYSPAHSVTLPIGVSGDFFVFVRTDLYNDVFEHVSEGNNTGFDATPVRVNLTPPPDLEVTAAAAPATALANHGLTVTYTVANNGATATPNAVWTDRVYLSSDATLNTATDLLLATQVRYGALDIGEEYQATVTGTLPQVLSGLFRVFVVTDASDVVFELDNANNTRLVSTAVQVDFRPPDLVVTSLTAPPAAVAGGSIAVGWAVSNVGSGDTAATSWTDRVVLSADATLGNADDVVLLDQTRTGLLTAGASYTTAGVVVPVPITVATGTYKLFLVTDASGQVFEHNAEGNNASAAVNLAVSRQTSDLQVTAATFTVSGPLQTGDPVAVTWTVSNAGPVATNANVWRDYVYLSTDTVLDAGDTVLGTRQRTNALAPGASYSASATYLVPAGVQGALYVLVAADAENAVFEELQNNNVRRADGTVSTVGGGTPTETVSVSPRPLPDLQVTTVDAPSAGFAGQLLSVSWTVRNAGPGIAGGSWYDSVYLSLDQNFEPTDLYLGYSDRPQTLAANATYTRTATFRIPQGTGGPFYVFVRADAGNAAAETSEVNNAGYDPVAVQVNLLPPADLVVGTITVPVNGVLGQNIEVTYTVHNDGVNPAQGQWTDSLFLSADSEWQVTDPLIGRVDVSATVAGGSSYTRTLTAPLPGVLPGQYQVIVRSDITNLLPEGNEGNNLSASLDRVALDTQELALGVAAAGSLAARQSAFYKVTVPAGETVRFVLDSVAAEAGTEVYVRYGEMPGRNQFDFAANEPFQADQTLTIPADQAGTYYVLVYRSSLNGLADYTLRADLVPFSLAGVSSGAGGDRGEFTVKIEGARFSPDTTFALVNAAGTAFPADRTLIQNTAVAYATFDLTFEAAGTYILQATRGSTTVTLGTPFRLQASTGADVVTDIEAASDLRPDRSYTLQLFYGNQGNQDAAAPLLLVESLTGTPLGLSKNSQTTGVPLQVLGVSPNGPLDILRPGLRGSVQVSISTLSAATGVDLRVRHILATDTRRLTDGEWAQVESSVRPAGVADAAWAPFWANMRTRIGTTWGDYVGFLNRLVVKVGSPDQANHDVKGLFAELFDTDPNFKPYLIAYGRLLDAVSGVPLAGVEVTAVADVNGRAVLAAVTTTGADGRYQFTRLQPGSYALGVTSGNFDQDREGAPDPTRPTFQLTGDADLGSAYVLDSAADPTDDGAPVFARDASGVGHLVWLREGQVWHAYNGGAGWVGGQVVYPGGGTDLSVVAAPNLLDGRDPGLLASWTEGVGNAAEVVFAVGRLRDGGGYEWSAPVSVTTDAVGDAGARFDVLADGRVLVTYTKQDQGQSAQDDGDLYYSLFTVPSAGLTFPPGGSGASAGPVPQAGGSFQIGWQHQFKTTLLGINVTAAVGLQGGGNIVDCKASASGGIAGSLEFDGPSIRSTLPGSGQLTAEWEADKKKCEWDFNRATAGWSISGSFDYKRGLFQVLQAVPAGTVIVASIEGTISIIEFFTTREMFNLEHGINFTVGAEFADWEWKFQEPFPQFVMPDSIGEASVVLQGGPYLRLNVGDNFARLDGFIRAKAQVAPSFALQELTGNVQFSGQVGSWSFAQNWSIGYTSGLIAASADGLAPSDIGDLVFAYNPAGALGTGAVYAGTPISAGVAADLLQDTPMVTARGPGGNVTGAWVRDLDPFAGVGSQVMVATLGASGWEAPVAIPGSAGFNRDVQLTVDGQGRLVAVWSHASSAGLGAGTTLAQLQAARAAADIVYSVYENGAWSAPAAIAATAGRDASAALRTGSDGVLTAAWLVRDTDGSMRLLAARWTSAGWTPATQVAAAASLGSPVVGESGGLLTVFWDQDVNPAADKNDRTIFSSTFAGGWSDPVAFSPLVDLAAPALAAAAPVYTTSILPPVPEDCCECKKPEPPPPPECGTYKVLNKETCEYETRYKPCVRQPIDPNDILGPEGFGPERWIPSSQAIPYTIRFENAPIATAPAQVVRITQTLDPDLNPNSFRIGSFGFSGLTFEVPANKAFYTTRLDLTATKGYFVDVAAGINVATREVFWELATVDPATGEAPLDANTGFLPVNNADGAGEGFVSYTVRPKSASPTGTRIDAEARIVFDTEGPIDTPPIFNTLDAEAPASAVAPLTPAAPDSSFLVTWAGADPNDGSGVQVFTIWVSEDGGPFGVWLANTTSTSATYVGEPGRTYAFYSVALDNAGNAEAAPATPDAVTATPGGTATVGDFVWRDANSDGIQNATEAGFGGVTVRIYSTNNTDTPTDDILVGTTATASDGSYQFTGLNTAAQYYLEVLAPDGFGFSLPNQGASDELDSDVAVTTGRTGAFSVVSGANGRWDAGLFKLSTIAGYVWNDADADNTLDSDEGFLSNWTVYLDLDDDFQLDAGEPSRLTDAQGAYSFAGLRPGTYVVAQVIPPGWEQTVPGAAGANSAGGTGFRPAYTYTGSTAEMSSPGGITADSATSTADCGCGHRGTGTTTTTTGELGDSYHPHADLINLDEFRADPRFAGVDGSGYSVVVIDTGIDVNHPFFGPDADGDGVADRIVYQYDFADRDTDASDRTGHGSHVASVLASQDARYAGLAPGANIIALKVFSDSGRGYFSYVEQALAWVIDNAALYNVAAINLSVGDGMNWSAATTMYGLGDELAALARMNVVTVAAAGNSYALFGRPGLAYPAADPNALAVGAVWDGDRGGPWNFGGLGIDYTTGADRVVSFSQRDASMLDVLSPGAVIGGANATGGVAWLRGTSMATPQVTGAALLAQQLAQQHLGRRLTPAEVRYLMQQSGVAVVDGDDEQDSVPNTGATFRRLDVRALAVAALSYNGVLPPADDLGGGGDPGVPVVPQDNRPYRYTIELNPEQDRLNVHFGDRYNPPTVTDVADVTPDPRSGAVETVDVTFSKPIALGSLGTDDLTLTRNGQTVPLAGAVLTFTQVGDTATYRIAGLAALTADEGQYSLTVTGANVLGTDGAVVAGSAADVWLTDLTSPTSQVQPLVARQTALTFMVTAAGTDPDNGGPASGVVAYDVYVSTDGGPFTLWLTLPMSAPTAAFTAESNRTYAFQSIARDAAGNVEALAALAEASTYVPDLSPPATAVLSVSAATPTFAIEVTGTDAGGSGLAFFEVFVRVDGGAAVRVSRLSAGPVGVDGVYRRSLTYQAIVDGAAHTYDFYSVGIDGAGNTEPAPSTPDASVSATFAVPAVLAVTGFEVQRGAAQRSYVRYLDVTFNREAGVPDLATGGRVRLLRYNLNGTGTGAAVSLAGRITVSGQALAIDFGTQGLGGNRNTTVGDGYYRLELDLDGDGSFETVRRFYRLLGDVNGDGAVTQADIDLITAAFGYVGPDREQDVNGDGVVNQTDRTITTRSLNRRLGAGLTIDD